MGAVAQTDTEVAAAVTDFYITGFGPFHKVQKNPSEELVQLLPAQLAVARASEPALSRVALASTRILPVAGDDVRSYLDTLLPTSSTPPAADAPSAPSSAPAPAHRRRAVHLHIGVDVSAARFRLERRAVNEAHFTCADQRGWQPSHAAIDAGAPADSALTTRLPTAKLVDSLRQRGFEVEESDDAGRFVCNYTYYRSLVRCAATEEETLFLHIPSAKTCQITEQLDFLTALLGEIAALSAK